EIEKPFKEHPPQLVDPKVLAAATAALDEVEKRMKDGDTRGAIRLMGKVPAAARANEQFASRASDVQKKLEQAGDAMLADVKPLIEKKDYVNASARLRELADGLTGLPVAAKARKEL